MIPLSFDVTKLNIISGRILLPVSLRCGQCPENINLYCLVYVYYDLHVLKTFAYNVHGTFLLLVTFTRTIGPTRALVVLRLILRVFKLNAKKRKHDDEGAIKPSLCRHRVIASSPSCFRSFAVVFSLLRFFAFRSKKRRSDNGNFALTEHHAMHNSFLYWVVIIYNVPFKLSTPLI